MEGSMKLEIKPLWDEVERVREESAIFLTSKGLEKDAVFSLSMVVGELVENSIKYGKQGDEKALVGISLDVSGGLVTVEVTNLVDDTAYAHLARLDRTIQWIRGFQDPFEAYVERMKEVARRQMEDKESGLGLVRIAYEGRAILDFFLDESEILNVSAVLNLE